MRRLALGGMLAVVLSSGAASAQGAIPYRGVQAVYLGPGATTGSVDAALDDARGLGANMVRIEEPWSRLEPNAMGARDPAFLALSDHAINGAAARGMKVLMTIDSTPCWASSAPDSIRRGCGPAQDRFGTSSYPPAQAGAFAPIVSFLIGRYGVRLGAFEIWNEPDQLNELYFAGPDKPRRYAEMVRAAYPAAKQANPAVPILAGSMVGANGNWLRALYAEHIQGFYDGLSVHYYDLVLASLRAIRAVQLQNGDSKPLWLAEFGWDSCGPRIAEQGGQRCVTLAAQAKNLRDIFPQLARARYLQSAIVFTQLDTSQYNFGLRFANGRKKPAYGVVQRALRSRRGGGSIRPVRLRLSRSKGRIVASGSVPAGDNVEITVLQGRRLLFQATIRPDRSERYAIALPAVLSAHGLSVQAKQLWSGRSARRRT